MHFKTINIFSCIIFLFISLLFSGCLEQNEPGETTPHQVMVTKVIDGDTIRVLFSNGSIATIRLLGIDCPETTIQNNHVNEYQNISNLSCLTYYGLIAKSVVTNLVNNSQVTITFDNDTSKKDDYNRFLCYVSINDLDVNANLLTQGYARVFTIESFSKKSTYIELQEDARENDKGLWGCQTSWTKLSIHQVHYNADGNDEINLNDEYIVFVNNNDKILDLSGWSIRDEQGNTFYFPGGFYLHPQTSITLYSGAGTNMSTALYWHHDTPVWNNDGDTVYVYNEKEIVVTSLSY